MTFPPGTTSFRNSAFNETSKDTVGNQEMYNSYHTLVLFILMQFFVAMGVSSIPNIMLGEVFPFK